MVSSPDQLQQLQPPELSQEQSAFADILLEACELQEIADVELQMMGQSGTVRYGLGRCAEHLQDMTPAEIKLMVLAKLALQQPQS